MFAELQSGLPFGRNGGPRPVVDRDDFDVSQVFLELRLSHQKTRFAIRAGRQELNHGDGTLVSTRDLNVRRGFDGIRVRVFSDQWHIDAFAVKPVKTQEGVFDDASDPNQTFWGVWAVPSTLDKHAASEMRTTVAATCLTRRLRLGPQQLEFPSLAAANLSAVPHHDCANPCDRLLARPVTLELAREPDPRERHRACLHHPLHGSLMCLDTDTA